MRLIRSFALLVAFVMLGSCVIGAPLGFSSGDIWSFPLIAPMENNEFLVPVKIQGKGPYLFMIDPDAEISSVDAAIRSELDLYTTRLPQRADERDKLVSLAQAEVLKVQVGDSLTITNTKMLVHKFGTYSSGGRAVRGILGRDIIADSLIFAADRDRGLAYLATKGHYEAPTDATSFTFRRYREYANAPRRRMVTATLNNKHKVTLHLDIGTSTSQLWPKKMEKFKLPKLAVRGRTVDELATTRMFNFGALAANLRVGDVQVNGLLMVPYGDMRTRNVSLDGALGLNFFANFNLVINWHKKTVWMSKRAVDALPLAKERMGRWGKAFDSCANAGCVDVVLESDQPRRPAAPSFRPSPPEAQPGGAPATASATQPSVADTQPTSEPVATPALAADPVPAAPVMPATPAHYTLRVKREAGAPARAYDVLIEAVDSNNKALGLPRILVTLPPGRSEITSANFDGNYGSAAKLVVIDVSPFPRECQGGNCVWSIRPKR